MVHPRGIPGLHYVTDALIVLDDNTYTNKTWAEVSGISVQEIHIMEVEFLSNMRYTLYASELEWEKWHVKLGKFGNYFDMASKTPLAAKPKSINLPAPITHHRPDLPTPPASVQPSPSLTQTSPPITHHSASLAASHFSFQPYPHPLSAPPHLPPNTITPPTHLAEVDARSYSRKRSHDDDNQETLARKRYSLTPSVNPIPTLTPGQVKKEPPSPIPRLPPPNLSITTGDHHENYFGVAGAQLPMPPGRSMATVFPGPSRWPQNGMLPSVQSGYLPGMNALSPMNEWSSRRSPYPARSATPSPTSLNFPSQPAAPGHASPSGYLYSRSSPYRPVRGVNTLLVPPPSASMHNPGSNMGFDQMYYQPLGKPISEQRAGVLPYMHHDGWSQPNPMSYVLPQPRFA